MQDIPRLDLQDTPAPNPRFLDGHTPLLLIDGREWPIPALGIKQNRIIVPLLMKTMPQFASLMIEGAVDAEKAGKLMLGLSEQTIDDLGTIIYTALTRAHPDLTRDMFNEMSLSIAEMFEALKPVVEACGLMVKGKAPAPGE